MFRQMGLYFQTNFLGRGCVSDLAIWKRVAHLMSAKGHFSCLESIFCPIILHKKSCIYFPRSSKIRKITSFQHKMILLVIM